MNKENRQKELKKIAKSSQGEALRELFEEKIRRLTDASTYDKDDFEIEGKTSLKAAAVLKSIQRELGILRQEQNINKTNDYV